MDLRDCPFCGAYESLLECIREINTGLFVVQCRICDAHGPPSKDESLSIEYWNERVRKDE